MLLAPDEVLTSVLTSEWLKFVWVFKLNLAQFNAYTLTIERSLYSYYRLEPHPHSLENVL